ncbi:hypothetical protein C2E23DRAFT_937169 [Lenzites betulinus]|nr:hypothetical protein C2E23DRAFT_937169 [Lenzites betulinus]
MSPKELCSAVAVNILRGTLANEIHSLSADKICSIEEELSAIVVSLRRERNARTIPNRLPLEVLLLIFLHARDAKDTFDDESQLFVSPPQYKTLVSITQVCHLWRTSAIAWPVLWSHIPNVPKRIATLFWGRIGPRAPLRVHETTAGGILLNVLIRRHPFIRSRVQELVLSMNGFSLGALMGNREQDVLKEMASSLRYLSITCPERSSEELDSRLSNRTLFGGEAPALKALSYTLRTGSLYRDRFPSLAHLRICGREDFVAGAFSVHDILTLLPNTLALETLYIRNTKLLRYREGSSVIVPNLPIVRLSRLRVGSIDTDDVDAAFALVQHLRVPPTGTLQIHHIQVLVTTVIDPTSPSRNLASAALGPLDILEVIISGTSFLHVRTRRPEGGGLWLEFYTRESGLSLRNMLLAPLITLLAPALACVHTLRVSAPWPEYKMGLVDAVLQATNVHVHALRTLIIAAAGHFSDGPAESLRRILAPKPASDGGAAVPLRSLTTIGFQSAGGGARFHQPFIDVLQQRAECGHALERVVMHGSRPWWQMSAEERAAARAVEGLVGAVEYATQAPWNVERDPAWRTENEYWALYPDVANSYWAWGGLFPGTAR